MASRTALLVIDMQVVFTAVVTEALPNVVKLCDRFTKAPLPIIFTQHGHSDYELKTTPSRVNWCAMEAGKLDRDGLP
ncbi:hypothetical protein H2204_001885 [Knufia peltigerae]|uniref:Isochorismatase-like domain-containing protein n=1 Tax=Knufia peltigerae TaxID=1002370 RepID=A0AA38YDX6_9EURO|nr:hypothetical protein H2204_001885 [Knufia peltigerae]